jgi:multiple sugar transport system substrate-binding protein
MNGRKLAMIMLIAFVAVFGFGCEAKQPGESGKQDASTAVAAKEPSPVTLKVLQSVAQLSDSEFQQYFVDTIKKKFPYITLEMVKEKDKGNSAEELLAAGTFPDIIYTSNLFISKFEALGVPVELSPFIKKNNFDLNRYDKAYIDTMKAYSTNGQLYAIPFSANTSTLLYNKDIFDKFGVAYPKDGMTWTETMKLAQKLHRQDGEALYRGIEPGAATFLGTQFPLASVDAKTQKAAFNNDRFKQVFNLLKSVYEMLGYVEGGKYQNFGFFTTNLAMFNTWVATITGAKKREEVNWDIVTSPYFEGLRGPGKRVDVHLMMISKLSKNQDAAFKVISYLASDEAQMILSQNGRISPVKNPELQKHYAENLPDFKGKNIQAIFKVKPLAPPTPTKYDQIADKILNNAAKELATKKTDINTLLRKAEEEANKAIAEEKSE